MFLPLPCCASRNFCQNQLNLTCHYYDISALCFQWRLNDALLTSYTYTHVVPLDGYVAAAVVFQEYERAKDLKRSLDKVARLRKKVMNMDQQLMAVIRGYIRPRPIVQDTMRALFLLLGNSLKETKVITIAISSS